MPTVESNRETWNAYDWKQEGGEEWSSAWGSSQMLWRVTLNPRLAGFLPAQTILEIAPGGGRVTAFLVGACERLHLVDVSPSALDACRERFRGREHVRYHLGSGASLEFLDDSSIDLAVSWDSLVHVESSVMKGYVEALATKLKPGGMAVLHHSNLGACRLPDGKYEDDMDQPANGWRAPSVSAEVVRQYCTEAGLLCVGQEVFPWSRAAKSDCITVFGRPPAPGLGARIKRAFAPAPSAPEPPVAVTDMPGEMARGRQLLALYRKLA